MKVFRRFQYLLSSEKKTRGIQGINLSKLKQAFEEHFKTQYKNYQLPLLSSDGLLSYTGRFARTVINQDYDQQERQIYFMKIKKSINSNKELTPQSCLNIIESLINFRFEGEENLILEKIRNYAISREKLWTAKEADRLLKAHKYIMVQKAEGPIKFKDLQLTPSKGQKQLIEQTVKQICKQYGLKQYKVEWSIKKQISFEIEINGSKKMVKLLAFNQKKNTQNDLEVLSNRILQNGFRQTDVIITEAKKQFQAIKPQILAKRILQPQQPLKPISQTISQSGSFYHNLYSKILKSSPNGSEIKSLGGDSMTLLNFILINSSQDNLKQFFGYLKLNFFQIEFYKLMHLIVRARQTTVSELQNLNPLNELQEKQLQYYKIVTQQYYYAKSLVTIMKNSSNKKIHIYSNENNLLLLFKAIIKQAKYQPSKQISDQQNIEKSLIQIEQQNRRPSTIINKLVLIQLIYKIPIQLSSLWSTKIEYQDHLHPLTHFLRFK